MRRPPKPQPVAGRHPITTGTAALVPDRDGRRGWTLYVNGMESSHVDLDDPTHLEFEYMRWMVAALQASLTSQTQARIVHLGGGGCSLARCLGALFEQSRQVVVEIDAQVLELVKTSFGLRSRGRLKLRVGEARAAVASLDDGGADVIIRDAFIGSSVPSHLRTRQFLHQVDRVLNPQGIYLANLADGQTLADARAEAATALNVFAHVALVAEPAQLRGRRHGNVVLAASQEPLAILGWQRRLASDPVRTRLMDTTEVRAFASGRAVLVDEEAYEEHTAMGGAAGAAVPQEPTRAGFLGGITGLGSQSGQFDGEAIEPE